MLCGSFLGDNGINVNDSSLYQRILTFEQENGCRYHGNRKYMKKKFSLRELFWYA